MTKWEYCAVTCVAGTRRLAQPLEELRQNLVMLKPSGEEKEEIQDLAATIANLGLEGWELVSHNKAFMIVDEPGQIMTQDETYMFKRQLTE